MEEITVTLVSLPTEALEGLCIHTDEEIRNKARAELDRRYDAGLLNHDQPKLAYQLDAITDQEGYLAKTKARIIANYPPTFEHIGLEEVNDETHYAHRYRFWCVYGDGTYHASAQSKAQALLWKSKGHYIWDRQMGKVFHRDNPEEILHKTERRPAEHFYPSR